MQGRKIIFVSIHVQLEKNGHRTLFYVFLALFGGREIMVTLEYDHLNKTKGKFQSSSVCLVKKDLFLYSGL